VIGVNTFSRIVEPLALDSTVQQLKPEFLAGKGELKGQFLHGQKQLLQLRNLTITFSVSSSWQSSRPHLQAGLRCLPLQASSRRSLQGWFQSDERWCGVARLPCEDTGHGCDDACYK
jgi:hypothetical protein